MSDNLQSFLTRCRKQVDARLRDLLDGEDRLGAAMAYAVFNGGKRVRPVLCYAAADLYDPDNELVHRAAAAVELIHAYSLVHDDLPAMDDDDLRRGHPTCHIAFDEATAILAGDALQSLAFEVLAGTGEFPAGVRLQLVGELTRAAGWQGMAGGQSSDLEAVGRSLTLAELESVHRRKTGALIRASVLMGAVAGQCASQRDLAVLGRFADVAGLAFQVKDDVLDEESNTEILGKRQGADKRRGKPTYTSLLGLEGARRKLAELHGEALDALSSLPRAGGQLSALADFIVTRDN